MICKKCLKSIDNEDIICPYCGHRTTENFIDTYTKPKTEYNNSENDTVFNTTANRNATTNNVIKWVVITGMCGMIFVIAMIIISAALLQTGRNNVYVGSQSIENDKYSSMLSEWTTTTIAKPIRETCEINTIGNTNCIHLINDNGYYKTIYFDTDDTMKVDKNFANEKEVLFTVFKDNKTYYKILISQENSKDILRYMNAQLLKKEGGQVLTEGGYFTINQTKCTVMCYKNIPAIVVADFGDHTMIYQAEAITDEGSKYGQINTPSWFFIKNIE